MTAPDLRGTGDRIDTLLDASGAGGAVARERAEELVRLVADLYGAGLERMMDLLHERGHLDEGLLAAMADDELLSGLLLVHGLHPYDIRTRVERALDGVRPYLGSHGGDVELLEVTDEGTVRLRLLGSCDGCPSSSVTLELAVEGAIEAAAPEVTAIQVETPSTTGGNGAPAVIPVTALRSRLDAGESEGSHWGQLPESADLPDGGVRQSAVSGVGLVVCRVGSDLFAFRDRCARCEATLGGATLARRLGGAAGDVVLRCPACRAHYDVRHAGACLDAGGLHLDPLPLLVADGRVSVAVPAPVST
jgi:Fe-S cluster biogenesis protein NfuA/nitrite reductase/ring-hydroxylating ferredoxin subunit